MVPAVAVIWQSQAQAAGRVAELAFGSVRVTTLVATEVVKLASSVAAPGAVRIWALNVAPVRLAA